MLKFEASTGMVLVDGWSVSVKVIKTIQQINSLYLRACWAFCFFCVLCSQTLADQSIPMNASEQWQLHKDQVAQWQPQFSAVEDWVDVKEYDDEVAMSDESLQVLIYDRQIQLNQQGELTQYFRIRQRINNRSGLESAGQLKIVVQPSYETLLLHGYDRIRDNKRTSLIDKNKIELLRQEGDIGSSIYSGNISVTQILDGLKVGDTIDYSYSIKGKNPVLGHLYSDYWGMGWPFDIAYARLRLVTPAGRTFSMKASEGAPKHKSNISNSWREDYWEFEDYQRKIVPNDIPPWQLAYPVIEVSEYSDWKAVSDWSVDVFKTSLAETITWPQAEQIIVDDRLSAKKKTALLLNLVQEDIRYFGIETGVNALVPSLPSETILREYGDCKDKSVLLTQLLRHAGVDAYTALVSTDNTKGIAQRLPGPHVFNHAIVTANIDGDTYWLDPTQTHQGDNLLTKGFPDYGFALIVGQKEAQLLEMQAVVEPRAHTNVVQRFVTDSQPITMSMERTYTGDIAELIRYRVESAGERLWNRETHSYYQKLYAGLSPEESKHRDDVHNNVYTSAHNYRLSQGLELNGSYWQLELYADEIRGHVEIPSYVDRQESLYLGSLASVEQKISIEHKHGIAALEYEPVEIDNPYYSYSRHIDVGDKYIEVLHRYESKVDEVNSEGLSDYVDDLRNTISSLSTVVLLKSPEEERFEQRNNHLKNKLRKLLRKKES